MFDAHRVRQDFPIFRRQIHGKPLVYLDSAATSQKPQQVIDAIVSYYSEHTANVHRGVHVLSDESSELWEQSRATIAKFFDAKSESLIMTRNTTEAINGVAYGWGAHNLVAGDVVLTTMLEHHSNLVVWQELCARSGAELVVCDVTDTGELDLEDMTRMLAQFGARIKLAALQQVSNVTGAVLPLDVLIPQIRAQTNSTARILLDAAQAASHLAISFTALGVDFLAFSGHKMLGPMGSGGLLVREELLQSGELRPWLFGGGMIAAVSAQSSTFHDDPSERFTAGTPDVASAVGLAAACDYLTDLQFSDVVEHDRALVRYAYSQLQNVPNIQLIGPTPNSPSETTHSRAGSVAFIYHGVHAHDVAQVLDSEGVAVRSGHHCTMPLHTRCNWQATTRASFQVYTTQDDIDVLVRSLAKVATVFSP